MSIDLETRAGVARPRLSKAGTLARFTLIGVALAAVAGTFAYLGGWRTPSELTPARFADAFEQIDGTHPGFRRNHAKGLGVSGSWKFALWRLCECLSMLVYNAARGGENTEVAAQNIRGVEAK